MLTTTVDGLWVLQAVTGVEQTCPELGLRPLLPRLDTAERALRHPVAAELMAVGALDQAGNADPMVREWLTVLLRRDLGLLVTIGVPGGEPTRAAICRFATWWVVLERHGNLVRLYPAGTASDEAGAGELVVGQVERLCGVAEAAPLRPVTVDADELLHAVRDAGTLRSYLLSQRLDVDQLQMVTMAADPTRSAHATLVALQAGVGPEKSARNPRLGGACRGTRGEHGGESDQHFGDRMSACGGSGRPAGAGRRAVVCGHRQGCGDRGSSRQRRGGRLRQQPDV